MPRKRGVIHTIIFTLLFFTHMRLQNNPWFFIYLFFFFEIGSATFPDILGLRPQKPLSKMDARSKTGKRVLFSD